MIHGPILRPAGGFPSLYPLARNLEQVPGYHLSAILSSARKAQEEPKLHELLQGQSWKREIEILTQLIELFRKNSRPFQVTALDTGSKLSRKTIAHTRRQLPELPRLLDPMAKLAVFSRKQSHETA